MDFAVTVKGVDDLGEVKQGRWVLAVVGDKLLVSMEEGVLTWVALEDCVFLKGHTPDQPSLVLPVQAQPAPGHLAIPMPNRAMRRENGRN